jgi:hypothetical protein
MAAGHSACMACAWRRAMAWRSTSRQRPATITRPNGRRGPANTSASRRCAPGTPSSASSVSSSTSRSARAPSCSPQRARPAAAAPPWRARSNRRAAVAACRAGSATRCAARRQALAVFQPAQFLRPGARDLAVGAHRQRRAAVQPAAAGRSGRRPGWPRCPGRSPRRRRCRRHGVDLAGVAWVACTSCQRASGAAWRASHSIGRSRWRPGSRRPRRSARRCGCGAACPRRPAASARIDAGCAARSEWTATPAAQHCRGEAASRARSASTGDAWWQSGAGRRAPRAVKPARSYSTGSSVRPMPARPRRRPVPSTSWPGRHRAAVGVVVQVVELADLRVAALQQLGVQLRGHRAQLRGRDAQRHAVHAVAPGPEVVSRLRAARPGRQRRAGRHGCAHRPAAAAPGRQHLWPAAALSGRDRSPAALASPQQHAGLPAPVDPGRGAHSSCGSGIGPPVEHGLHQRAQQRLSGRARRRARRRAGFVHVGAPGHLQLHRVHALGRAAVVARDVAALEAAVQHLAEAAARPAPGHSARAAPGAQLRRRPCPGSGRGSRALEQPGQLALDAVAVEQHRMAVRARSAPVRRPARRGRAASRWPRRRATSAASGACASR